MYGGVSGFDLKSNSNLAGILVRSKLMITIANTRNTIETGLITYEFNLNELYVKKKKK